MKVIVTGKGRMSVSRQRSVPKKRKTSRRRSRKRR